MIDPEVVDLINEQLSRGPEDFYRESHQHAWAAILSLAEANKNIDLITVTNQLKSVGLLERAGGPSYLDSLISLVQSSAHASSYARIVAEHATERRLHQAAGQILQIVHDPEVPHVEKVDRAEQLVFSVADGRRTNQLQQINSTLDEVMDDAWRFVTAKQSVTGLATGFRDLDELTSGLQPEDLIIVGARPSMGKTAFCMGIAQNVATHPEKPGQVAVFSLEMSKKSLTMRLVCSAAQISEKDLRKGNVRDHELQRLTRVRNAFHDLPLHIDDTPGMSVLEMKAKARRMKRRVGLDLIVIDYLQLMLGGTKPENRALAVAEISRQLKCLAKELKVPIIALSQVSRGVEARTDKRPGLADLRESGAIEQDADLVMFLYRDEYYNPLSEDAGVAEVIVAKHRNGPVDTVKLAFQKRFAAFQNLEHGLRPAPEHVVRPAGVAPPPLPAEDLFETVGAVL